MLFVVRSGGGRCRQAKRRPTLLAVKRKCAGRLLEKQILKESYSVFPKACSPRSRATVFGVEVGGRLDRRGVAAKV